MCHFITGLIDKHVTLDDINKVGQGYAITFDKCDNDFVKLQLKNDEDYLVRRAKYCDCGTQLGLATRTDVPDAKRIEKRELDKLKRKGWSQTKINRYLKDKEKAIDKDIIKYDKIVNGVHLDIENWIDYLKDILALTKVQHFGLLLHWYKGGVENERIKLKDRMLIKVSQLTPDVLLKMEEDVVYDLWR